MIDLKVVENFFDKDKVVRAADRATRRVLSRFGAFVRTTARRSIRVRKSVSSPGKPPTSRTGLLREHIYFSYDARARDVVIGPVAMGSRRSGGRGNATIAPTGIPALLEYGGRVKLKRRGKTVSARYRPRPYMGPAFEKELPQLAGMWANSIK